MANTQVVPNKDGTLSVVSDSYAAFGTVGGMRSTPEPKREDPAADRMLTDEVAKRLNTPPDRLDFWLKWGMPSAAGRISTGGAFGSVPFWSRRKIERFIAELHELTAAVGRIR